MTTENQHKSHHLLSKLISWASDANQIANFQDQEEDLELIFRAFLTSDFADHVEQRNSALVLFDSFKRLLLLLSQANHDDFKYLDEYNLTILLHDVS